MKLSQPAKRNHLKAWVGALEYSWRQAVRVDRSQLVVATALRSAVGLALPLTIGVMTGHILTGVSIAGGAAILGGVGLTFTYRARTRLLLFASIGLALSALVGSLTGRFALPAILIIGIWGFGAGMLVSISQSAMLIGLQSMLAFIVLSHFALSPPQAVIQALLMLSGALLQTALGFIPLPGYTFSPERAALSTVYQVLADKAEDPSHPLTGGQINEALTKAETTLAGSDLTTPRGKVFATLFNQAEQMHLDLIVLTQIRQSQPAHGDETATRREELLQSIFQSTVVILRAVANSLCRSRLTQTLTEPRQQLEQAIVALRRQTKAGESQELNRQALIYGEALRRHLSTVEQVVRSWRNKRSYGKLHLPHRPKVRLRDPLDTLRANLTLRSTACRHAIRLGVTLAVATALYHVLPLERGYWVPLTVLLVLKPDFSTTFSRGVARSLGTVLGALMTTLVIAKLAPTPTTLIVLDTIAAFISFSLLNVNYALFSSFITAVVIFLLAFINTQALTNIAGRLLDTLIGGVLALLAYVLWPTWEHTQVRDTVALYIEALSRFLTTTLQAYGDPSYTDLASLQQDRKEARLARSNAESSIGRLQKEPVRKQFSPETAQGLLASTDALAKSLLALEAYLQENSLRVPFPELKSFSQEASKSLRTLAGTIRQTEALARCSDLHKALSRLKRARKTISNEGRAEIQFVCAEADAIVRSIDTTIHLLTGDQA